eukprot:5420133-Prymnesium_polylepis.1
MTDDGRSSSSTKIEFPPFPGEVVLAHEGFIWKTATTVKLAPHELVVVAETGIPPAANAIIDVDIDDFPELSIIVIMNAESLSLSVKYSEPEHVEHRAAIEVRGLRCVSGRRCSRPCAAAARRKRRCSRRTCSRPVPWR